MKTMISAALAALTAIANPLIASAQTINSSAKSTASDAASAASGGVQTLYYGVPLWMWIAGVVLVLLLVALFATHRKRRQAIISTRLG